MHPEAEPLNLNSFKLSFGIRRFGTWEMQAINAMLFCCYISFKFDRVKFEVKCAHTKMESAKMNQFHLFQVSIQISENWKTAKRSKNVKWNRSVDLMITHCAKVRTLRVPGNFSFYNVKIKIILFILYIPNPLSQFFVAHPHAAARGEKREKRETWIQGV